MIAMAEFTRTRVRDVRILTLHIFGTIDDDREINGMASLIVSLCRLSVEISSENFVNGRSLLLEAVGADMGMTWQASIGGEEEDSCHCVSLLIVGAMRDERVVFQAQLRIARQ